MIFSTYERGLARFGGFVPYAVLRICLHGKGSYDFANKITKRNKECDTKQGKTQNQPNDGYVGRFGCDNLTRERHHHTRAALGA